MTHMPCWQALPSGSPVRSQRWEVGGGCSISCSFLSCSIPTPQVHDHGLVWTTSLHFKLPSNQHTSSGAAVPGVPSASWTQPFRPLRA